MLAVFEVGGNRRRAALAIVWHLVACGASIALEDAWGYTGGGS